MATSRARSLFQDHSQSIQFDGSTFGAKGKVLKSQNKVAPGGKNEGTTRTRKPLQSLNNRNNFESIDIGSSMPKSLATQKNENVLKGGEKGLKATLTRKPLCDLTNSKKPQRKEEGLAVKKNLTKQVSAVQKEVDKKEEEDNSWIAEEGFLHNHDECIKQMEQRQIMSTEYYMDLLGMKELSPPVVKPQPPPRPSPSLEVDTSLMELMEDDDGISLPEMPSPKLSFSSTWDMRWDLLNIEPNFELKPSPPRN